MTGADWIRELIGGEVRLPPAWELLGLRFTGAEEGSVTVEMDIRPELLNSTGVVQGGLLASLADVAMGTAVFTLCRAREAPATLEMKLNFVRATPADAGIVRAEGRVLGRGRSVAHAEAEVLTSSGRLVAKATGTFTIKRIAEPRTTSEDGDDG